LANDPDLRYSDEYLAAVWNPQPQHAVEPPSPAQPNPWDRFVAENPQAPAPQQYDHNVGGKRFQLADYVLRYDEWDDWRDTEVDGVKVTQYLYVEMNTETGRFQIWRGTETEPQRILVTPQVDFRRELREKEPRGGRGHRRPAVGHRLRHRPRGAIE
jgi:hypothetical protein